MAKIKLQIKTAKDPETFGTSGARKVEFFALNEGGETLEYKTFKPALFDAIKENEGKGTIEVDMEVKTRGEYTDRVVSQVYVGGSPVGTRQGGGSGYRGGGKSPEEVASIEAQVAFKGVVDLIGNDHLDSDSELGKKALNWADKKLDQVPVARSQPAETKAYSQATAKKASPAEETKPEESGARTFKNVGEFLKACQSAGVPRSQVIEHLGVDDTSLAKINTTEAWELVYDEIIKYLAE
ncbi:hypothetical protein CMI37_13800 [Candidatus Pacearchaeota archaeon]|nr:hypothetical protein [Candidatus Pacearchaeota archaeon]|tara:strand:- start:1413 stop:2129 length:717 start_codon:yes stop_codon:yes gene_type:complete